MIHKLKEYSKYFLIFILAVFIVALMTNFTETVSILKNGFSSLLYLINRFIIGFSIAYFMNFFVMFLRKRLRLPKPLAITAAYLVFLGIVAWMLVYIIPLMADSVNSVISQSKYLYGSVRSLLESAYISLDASIAAYVSNSVNEMANAMLSYMTKIFTAPTISTLFKSSTRMVLNITFGFLISIYALVEKDTLINHSKAIIEASFPEKRASGLLDFFRQANDRFSRFLVGKFLDSLIIGLLSYILYAIFQIGSLSPFLAIVAGVTNMIPYFGPIVGGAITVLILLCFNPIAALYALIIVIVLQTFDGMLLGPKILGDAVGISPLLIIFAITVGGDLAGFFGMLVGVPLLAVIKDMFYMKFIDRKKEKEILATVGAEVEVTDSADGSGGSP